LTYFGISLRYFKKKATPRDGFSRFVGHISRFFHVLQGTSHQSLSRAAVLSFLLTAFIETSQLFIGRSVDVDDLILNFIGGFAGALLYFALRKRFPQLEKFAV